MISDYSFDLKIGALEEEINKDGVSEYSDYHA